MNAKLSSGRYQQLTSDLFTRRSTHASQQKINKFQSIFKKRSLVGHDGAPYGKQPRAISSRTKSIRGEAERKTGRKRLESTSWSSVRAVTEVSPGPHSQTLPSVRTHRPCRLGLHSQTLLAQTAPEEHTGYLLFLPSWQQSAGTPENFSAEAEKVEERCW